MKFRTFLLLAPLLAFALAGCADSRSHSKGVYMLLDTSGTYVKEIGKAQQIINYLLANLNSGDSFAVAKVETRSFSEKDIIAKVTFDRRPSFANQQKRAFMQTIARFVNDSPKGSAYTDITGALIQGAEFLNEANPGSKTILIFSDMQEDLQKGTIRDFPIKLNGIRVVAVNVTKLRTDNVDPRLYLGRLERWKKRVLDAGASEWLVINDLDHLDEVLGTH
jgi:hypothetical protein